MNLTKKIFLFSALSSAALLSSCINTKLENEDTPASLVEVQDALASAWGEADPLTMTPGDFLFQETEQRINGNPDPFYVLQEGISISKKEDLPTEYKYTYLYQTREYKNGQEGSLSTREDTRSVGKAPGAQTLNLPGLQKNPDEILPHALDNQMTLGFERVVGLLFACEQTAELDKYCKESLKVDSCKITCSNLKTSESQVPVPTAIQQQTNCGGFASCQWTEKIVAFDWEIQFKTGGSIETQRVNYSIALSPDLPFFARLTRYCFRQLYPIQGTQLLVDTCTHLRNFTPAQPQ